MIHSLREHFPAARICALVNSYNAPILQHNPNLDEIYAYTKAKHRPTGQTVLSVYWNRIRLMHRIRKERFDYAILAGARFLHRALRTARMVKPLHIIGFTEPNERGTRHIDIGVPYALPKPMHEVEDIYRLLAPLGIEGEPPEMFVMPDPWAKEQAKTALRECGITADSMRIGVHISARKTSNRWPVQRFIELIRLLYQRYSAAFMLFWSPGSKDNPFHPGDDEKAQQIMKGCQGIPILDYYTEQLWKLVGGLAHCPYLICSDGGAMHIAAALGSSVLCFFGRSDPARWHPWRSKHVLLQPDSEEVEDISVDEAMQAFDRLLGVSRQIGS
jgi:ADP-heptose:LPS heptosyltransferase